MNTGYQYTTSSCRCGLNAECSIIQQRHVCSCIAGYRGDPLNKCTYSECESKYFRNTLRKIYFNIYDVKVAGRSLAFLLF